MHKYLILLLFLILSACTDKSNNKDSIPTTVYKLSVQGSGDFGSVSYGQIPVKTIVVTNDSLTPKVFNPSLSSSSPFQIAFTLGCALVEPGKSCMVKVLFNTNDKIANTYTDNLTIDNQLIPLSASLASVPSVSYSIIINQESVTGEEIDLGTIQSREIKLVNIKIKNQSPINGEVLSLTSSNNAVLLVANSCVNISLTPGKSCYAKAYIKGLTAGNNISSVLTFGSKTINLNLENQVVDLASQFEPSTPSVEMGDFSMGEDGTVIKALGFTNNGNGAGSINNISLPQGYTIGSNNCEGVKPGNKCVIRLIYKNEDKNKGQYVDSIDFGDTQVSTIINQVNKPNDLSQIVIQAPTYVHVDNCQSITIDLKDHEGLPFISSLDTTINSSISIFSDNLCQTIMTEVIIDKFTSSKIVYVKKTAGLVNLNFSKNLINANQNITFYESLSLVNNNYHLVTNQSHQINPINGVPPYTFEMISGNGNVSSSGLFVSPLAGLNQVKVKDFINQEQIVSLMVVLPLTASGDFDLAINQSHTVVASHGLPPYTFSKISGVGTINSTSGVFNGGTNSGSSQIKVTDALNQEVTVTAQVYGALVITPSSTNLMVGTSRQFIASIGKSPYTYTVLSGGGAISNSGLYTAPASGTNAQIKVVDSHGQEAIASISLHPQITISTTNCNDIPESQSCLVTSSGGYGSKTYSTNQGTINSTSGLFTGACSGISGSTTVTVMDSLGNTAQSNIVVPCAMNSCKTIKDSGYGLSTNTYWIDPDGLNQGLNPFKIVCEMDTDGGGWDVLQMRTSNTNFYQFWSDYQNGFGTIHPTAGNYWIGNDRINKITPYTNPKEIYFKLKRSNGITYYQRYPLFSVKDSSTQYLMNVNSVNTGTALDSFTGHNGSRFSTRDSDNDTHSSHCAQAYTGAWWYYSCHDSNLNGTYGMNQNNAQGINWASLTGYGESLVQTAIMVRTPRFDYPRNCLEAYNNSVLNLAGNTGNGSYIIDPDGANTGVNPITVTCDMVNGGWTLVNDQFPTSITNSGCNSGYGVIDATGLWKLSANAGGEGSSTHGGCGISLRVRVKLSQVKITDASFTANANCGSVLFPNTTLNIAKDLEGPVLIYSGNSSGQDYHYPGWNYVSKDLVSDSISSYNQSGGLTNGIYSVSNDFYYLHMGVGSFTGCFNRPSQARVWFK